jgi:hypothetical protein
MIIGYARVSTKEQNLGLRHDDLKPAFDASVDQTEAAKVDVTEASTGPHEVLHVGVQHSVVQPGDPRVLRRGRDASDDVQTYDNGAHPEATGLMSMLVARGQLSDLSHAT